MFSLSQILCCRPCCKACIRGNGNFPELHGTVSFIKASGGTVVVTELHNLPSPDGVYAMHIHNGTECTGTLSAPFDNTGSHLNLDNQTHPFHMGDLPAVFSNKGFSWNAVYTDRFFPEQVTGYTVIIHSMPDDFRTQPSGNSGEKIACGEIR
ncbi:MAG: superoxide dismutase family protein [Ruminococcus sp.]|nr:superoxide dismutase family protein [Ruminococcus sp.]